MNYGEKFEFWDGNRWGSWKPLVKSPAPAPWLHLANDQVARFEEILGYQLNLTELGDGTSDASGVAGQQNSADE